MEALETQGETTHEQRQVILMFPFYSVVGSVNELKALYYCTGEVEHSDVFPKEKKTRVKNKVPRNAGIEEEVLVSNWIS